MGRAGEIGDQVLFDVEGALAGVRRPECAWPDFGLRLGSNRLIPGCEDQLVGAKAGEAKTIELTFPAEYPAKDFAGKAAVFEVQVKGVREPVEAAIDDDLAKGMGFDDLNGLRDAVRRQTEGEFKNVARQKLKRQLLDKLAESETFEVPAGMVDLEFEAIWKQIEQARQHHLETKDDPKDRKSTRLNSSH